MIEDPIALLRARGGHRNEDSLYTMGPAQLRKLIHGAHHFNIVDSSPLFARIVVDKPDDLVVEREIPPDLTCQYLSGIPGADDDGTGQASQSVLLIRLSEASKSEARSTDQRQAHQPIDDEHRPRNWRLKTRQLETDEDARAQCHRLQDRRDIAHPDVTPQILIQPEPREGRHSGDERQRKRADDRVPGARRHAEVEAEQEGEEVRDCHQPACNRTISIRRYVTGPSSTSRTRFIILTLRELLPVEVFRSHKALCSH